MKYATGCTSVCSIPILNEADVEKFPEAGCAGPDTSRSLEDRARSYLDANCAQCHRPRGTVAYFDARYDTPLEQQGLISGRVLIDQRIDSARVIAPNDLWRSILFMRANTVEGFKMPPLARNTIDTRGMELLQQWIEGLLMARPCCHRRIFCLTWRKFYKFGDCHQRRARGDDSVHGGWHRADAGRPALRKTCRTDRPNDFARESCSTRLYQKHHRRGDSVWPVKLFRVRL